MPFGKLRSMLVATADSIAPLAAARLRLARRLTDYCRKTPALRDVIVIVAFRQGDTKQGHFVLINRTRNRINISCSGWIAHRFDAIHNRLYPVVALVAAAPLNRLQFVAEISDGEDSGPGIVSFCSPDSRSVLIPDQGFVLSRGYERFRWFADTNQTAWTARNDRIVWRGSTTGVGHITKDPLSADDPELIQRTRLCLRLNGVPGTDVKISGVAQSKNGAIEKARLAQVGILGEQISPAAWNTFKFAIDVDGNSNAWSNLFTRLLMGCCVLKVASPTGYRQWYYGDLEPWTHFVPVKADLSDLRDRIAWCRANLDECERIAASGQAFAMARGFEAEIAGGARRLCEAFATGSLRAKL